MAGRNDFGILKARALGDARVLRAAELYTRSRLAKDEVSLGAVLGHVVCLGLWTSRETDDGRLPGDGVAVLRAALIVSTPTAKRILEILTAPDVDLITQDEQGLRLRGFNEAYLPLLQKRETARDRAAKSRKNRETASRVTFDECHANERRTVGVTCAPTETETETETVENPPKAPTTGGSASPPGTTTATAAATASSDPDPTPGRAPANPDDRPLGRGEREGVLAACGVLIGTKDIDQAVRTRARDVDRLVRAGAPVAAAVREFLRAVVYPRQAARIAYLGAAKAAAG